MTILFERIIERLAVTIYNEWEELFWKEKKGGGENEREQGARFGCSFMQIATYRGNRLRGPLLPRK